MGTNPSPRAKGICEEWRDVKGFEGLYQVSSLGRVKSVRRVIPVHGHPTVQSKTIPERILRQKFNQPLKRCSYGRYQVSLWKENRETTKKVSRLVAEAFIPNESNMPCVLHLDDNPKNNSVENLMWGDHEENVRQAAERDRVAFGDRHHASKLSHLERQNAYRLLLEGIRVKEVARLFGVKHQVISDLKLGRIKGFASVQESKG